MNSTDPIDVVAAVIYSPDSSHILLSLRKPEQHQGDLWEFPGGKLKPHESQEHALLRELDEELGIHVLDYSELQTIEHKYPDKTVRLYFWNVTRFSNEPIGREGQEVKWVSRAELAELEFPEANWSIVDMLCQH
jgi:8-oxo-dGTP diphosphatase